MSDVLKNLKNLLGPDKTGQVQDALKQAQATLDAVGVERKAEEEAKPDDAILSALESAGAEGPAKLVKGILDALAGDALTALEKALGSHEAVVTLLLKAVSGEPGKEEPTSPDGAVPPAYAEEMKSVKDYIASTTKDMGDIARSFVEIAKVVKSSHDESAALKSRLDEIEKKVGDRPRQASTATETIVEGKGAAAEKAVQKSLDDEVSVAGIRVKKSEYEKVKNSRGK